MKLALFSLFASLIPLSAQSFAGPSTAVLVNLRIKPGVDRAEFMKVMPDEARETLKLYLDGKIQNWYTRSDGTGALFILNVTSVAEAKALFDALPLGKTDFTSVEFIALGPLTPLRLLLAEPRKNEEMKK
jgi:hypothetical protein